MTPHTRGSVSLVAIHVLDLAPVTITVPVPVSIPNCSQLPGPIHIPAPVHVCATGAKVEAWCLLILADVSLSYVSAPAPGPSRDRLA